MKHTPINIAILLAMAFLMAGCGGKTVSTEKTAAQRAEYYHKNLTTSDLSLFELKGNVLRVVYPKGVLAQYCLTSSDEANRPDTITFTPTGLLDSSFLCGADSTVAMRNVEGEIFAFGDADGNTLVNIARNKEGNVTSWTLRQTTCHLTSADGKLTSFTLSQPGGNHIMANVKTLTVDKLGNWTSREVTVTGRPTIKQQRVIIYF